MQLSNICHYALSYIYIKSMALENGKKVVEHVLACIPLVSQGGRG